MFLTSLVTIPVNAQTFHELQNSNYNQIKLIEDVVEDEKFIRETNEYMKKSIGEVGSVVLRDRKIMANDGILVVIANIDMEKRNLLIKPNITTRGFILVNENEQLIKEIETTAYSIIKDKLDNTKDGINDIKSKLITDLIPFIENKTGRRPIILPVIIDIKK